jgi:hypothetical protein
VKQNNTMMSMCLNKSLTATAKASLLTYRNEYTFDGVEYAPLMYKIIMCLVTIDSVATTQNLWDMPWPIWTIMNDGSRRHACIIC